MVSFAGTLKSFRSFIINYTIHLMFTLLSNETFLWLSKTDCKFRWVKWVNEFKCINNKPSENYQPQTHQRDTSINPKPPHVKSMKHTGLLFWKGTDQWKHSQMNSLSAALIGSPFKCVSHNALCNECRIRPLCRVRTAAVPLNESLADLSNINTQTHEGETTAIHRSVRTESSD